MRRIFISASYARLGLARQLAMNIREAGHEVVSSWHDTDNQHMDDGIHPMGGGMSEEQAVEFAGQALIELRRADTFLGIAESEHSKFNRGGRHVEFGYALATGKYIAVLGAAENAFYRLPQVRMFHWTLTAETFVNQFLDWLQQPNYRVEVEAAHEPK